MSENVLRQGLTRYLSPARLEALRAARRVAEAHIPAVVIDTERQFVSLGLAAQVAQVMGAPCYRVEELRARPLAQLVRGHSPAAG